MSRIKAPRDLCLLLMVVLCLAAVAQALDTSEAREIVRQAEAIVDGNAASLEERQGVLKKLEEASRLFLSTGETVEAARVLNHVGHLQLILNEPRDAVKSHRQALALLKRTPDLEAEVDSLNGLGTAYLSLQEKERAEEALRKALALSEQAGYVRGQGQTLLTLAELRNYDNHMVALQTAQAALAVWQTLNDKDGLARAYSQVGLCYTAQYILPEATENYEKALGLWRDLNNRSKQAGALIMLGYIEYRKGEWQNSISLLTQAQGLVDEKDEPFRMGQIASGLGDAFAETGLPENSVIHYQRALDYYRQTQKPHSIAFATSRLGYTHYLLRNYTEALTYLQQSLEGVARDSIDAAQISQYLGRVYIAKGEYALALRYLQSALKVFVKSANPKEAGQVRALMGQIYQQQGEYEQARGYYRQALESFIKTSDRVNQAAVYFALGQLELKQKRYAAAEDYLRQSIEVTENIRRVSTSTDLTAAFSAAIYERYEKYIECLMRRHEAQPTEGFAVRAFEASDLARARSLAELLRATQTNLIAGLDPKLAEREKSLRQSLKAKENYRVTLLGGAYRKEELDALEAELARLEGEYKQVIASIHARYPSYEQVTRPTAWDARQIQQRVVADDQTVLLEYSLGADRSYVWAVTLGSIRSYELPAQSRIVEAARKVHQLLVTPPGKETVEELSSATGELGRMILSPVAAELKKRRIIVVPDGVLNYIPFQALPSPSNGEPLVVGYEVVNTPSASILGELRQEAARRGTPAKVLAAFGDPVFASNYAQRKGREDAEPLVAAQTVETEPLRPALRDIELKGDSFDPSDIKPLFYARRELANLREVADGGGAFVAADFAATREQLLSTDLTQYAILHFATHGLLDPKRPENSGLVLSTINRAGQAQNGFVGLQDIYELRAPVELVVLSACRTALGKDVRGEGLMGLTRGFMYAGASSVVASLWKVDDEATAELMKQFYTNLLQKGMPPAAALRAAQNSIRQRPEWSSPYYWAAFTLQGEYRRVIKARPSAGATLLDWGMMLGGMLTLSSGSALWYRRRKRRTARES